jgi:hypothetical protein
VSERTEEAGGGSILGAAVGGAIVSGLFGLAFGLLGELPWEDVKTDAGAFALVGGLFNAGRAIRARLRASGT